MNKSKIFEGLKQDYEKVEIPSGLDMAIKEGILKGKKEEKNEKMKQEKRRLLTLSASIIISLGALTAGVNIVPAFADGLESIPVLGKIVDVLRFVDGRASGGTITDGTDIHKIDLISDEESETLVVRFNQDGQAQNLTGAYTLSYSENPYVMTFTVAGARMVSAIEDFESIKESKFVDDVYTLVTLDDSMIRFNVVFNTPVVYEVIEMKEPASLLLKLWENNEKESFKGYSIRTLGYEKGEGFAILEESIMFLEEGKGYRILKDKEDLFYIEFAQLETKEDSMRLKAELEELTGIEIQILILE